jgi:hypothetical protein
MNGILTRQHNARDKKAVLILTVSVLAFVVMTLTQDYVRASFKNSAFYFSEAFMFSSFWWIFAPLLFAQYLAVKHKKTKRLWFQLAIIVVPLVVHLLAFPFLVWALSKTFYYHTYAFQQTFRYALSEHSYLLVLLYAVPVSTYRFLTQRRKSEEVISETEERSTTNQFVDTLLVSEGKKKLRIAVREILYLSASSPYISVHLNDKKYLYNETLKSISTKLHPEQFVRVHKSTIVNIEMVASYTTRLNGDYDLTMNNNAKLRVSRNFASDLKKLFSKASNPI